MMKRFVLCFCVLSCFCLAASVARAQHDNPALDAEHRAVMDLVPDSAVTHEAIGGNWSDPGTWDNGLLPVDGSNVLIPADVTVTVDKQLAPAPRTVRVDGTLDFLPDVATELRVDTLIVTHDGTLRIEPGTGRARIVIANPGPIDTAWDPKQFSRGIVSHGTVELHGAETTGFLPMTDAVGSTLTLAESPVGWEPGERVVLTGLAYGKHDVRTIIGVSGSSVTLDAPLANSYAVPDVPGARLYAANLDRNCEIVSQNNDVANRGHVMFMHAPTINVSDVEFSGLGRTRKNVPISATNANGRYSLHVHRARGGPAVIRSVVANGSPGWGIVNHSSHVMVSDSVAYNVAGAGFASEAGDETGEFTHNLATYMTGPSPANATNPIGGHLGHGFWNQGPAVTVNDNVAAECTHAGLLWFTEGLVEADLGLTRFPAELLDNQAVAMGKELVPVGNVPIYTRGNESFACKRGVQFWFHQLASKHGVRSSMEDTLCWNIFGDVGAFVTYASYTDFKNVRLYYSGTVKNPIGFRGGANGGWVTFTDCVASNFYVGMSVPLNGTSSVTGGSFDSRFTNFDLTGRISNSRGAGRVFHMDGVTFGTRAKWNVSLNGNLDFTKEDQAELAFTSRNPVGSIFLDGRPLFLREQAESFVPFPVVSSWNAEWVGKTNAQLFAEFGMAVCLELAPADAEVDAKVLGLIGGAP